MGFLDTDQETTSKRMETNLKHALSVRVVKQPTLGKILALLEILGKSTLLRTEGVPMENISKSTWTEQLVN